MTTYSLADWAGLGGLLALVGAALAPYTVGAVWSLVAVAAAVALLAFAGPRWRAEAVATRHAREVEQRRANIHALEADLGFEPIRWDD